MKKENQDILNKIQKDIESIVSSECNFIYADYKALKRQSEIDTRRIKELERDIERKDRDIKKVQGWFQNAKDCLAELSKDKIVDMMSGGDQGYDEHGNGGGYVVELVEYKGVQYELMYDSF